MNVNQILFIALTIVTLATPSQMTIVLKRFGPKSLGYRQMSLCELQWLHSMRELNIEKNHSTARFWFIETGTVSASSFHANIEMRK